MNIVMCIANVIFIILNIIVVVYYKKKIKKNKDKLKLASELTYKASSAKNDFLSSMSHEIRTPLNTIAGLSEYISLDEDTPPHLVEDVKDIMIASNKLVEIVGNILDINQIDTGKLEIVNEVYDFRNELNKIINLNKYKIENKNLTIRLNIGDELPNTLIGDKTQIKTILNNLISNAIKFSDTGEINVIVSNINENDNCLLIIKVIDTGIGIKGENIEKLFNNFERLDTNINSNVEGTGLGLSITKKLVELMGGTIKVDSKYKKGTTFTVEIPQKIKSYDKLLQQTEQLDIEKIKEISSIIKQKKILIIDDNKLNIKVAAKLIEEFNFIIDECYDGLEALEKIKNNKYDLILSDIMMPNMNGEELIKKLKLIEDFNTPIIAVTADTVSNAANKYIDMGFNDYIKKPFNKELICKCINKIIYKKM